MNIPSPKKCCMCSKVWSEVPERHRLDEHLQVYYWECNGSLYFQGQIEPCMTTMTFMPDKDYTLQKIREDAHKERKNEPLYVSDDD